MVQQTWQEMPNHYAGLEIDEFVVMPDHIHGIIILDGEHTDFSLSDAVQRFKSLTTARYRRNVLQDDWPPFAGKLWQRSYYDQIVLDAEAMRAIQNYIAQNPLRHTLSRKPAAD